MLGRSSLEMIGVSRIPFVMEPVIGDTNFCSISLAAVSAATMALAITSSRRLAARARWRAAPLTSADSFCFINLAGACMTTFSIGLP